jgi:hypothetical protein
MRRLCTDQQISTKILVKRQFSVPAVIHRRLFKTAVVHPRAGISRGWNRADPLMSHSFAVANVVATSPLVNLVGARRCGFHRTGTRQRTSMPCMLRP